MGHADFTMIIQKLETNGMLISILCCAQYKEVLKMYIGINLISTAYRSLFVAKYKLYCLSLPPRMNNYATVLSVTCLARLYQSCVL